MCKRENMCKKNLLKNKVNALDSQLSSAFYIRVKNMCALKNLTTKKKSKLKKLALTFDFNAIVHNINLQEEV